jgi:hypothetical protein
MIATLMHVVAPTGNRSTSSYEEIPTQPVGYLAYVSLKLNGNLPLCSVMLPWRSDVVVSVLFISTMSTSFSGVFHKQIKLFTVRESKEIRFLLDGKCRQDSSRLMSHKATFQHLMSRTCLF